MSAPELPAKKLKDFSFQVERSIRYHARRQAFYESFDTIVNALNLILGSGAVISLISDQFEDWFAGVLAALVAIVSFINLAMRSAEKGSLHSQLKQRHNDLLKRVRKLDPAALNFDRAYSRCEDQLLDIERDEPPINRLVDLMSHNELALSQGAGNDYIYYVPPFKAFTANLWRYEVSQPKTMTKHLEDLEKGAR